MNIKKILLLLLITTFSFNSFAQVVKPKPDALKLYNEGRYRESISVCEDEIALTPGNIDSYVVLTWALIANGQYAEAEKRATEARRIDNNDVRIIEALAEAKYFLSKYNEALSLFQRYVATVQENGYNRRGRAYYYMGLIYINQGKYQHADIALTMAVRIEGLSERWWERLGFAREKTKDYLNAINAYDKALQLNSTYYDAIAGKNRCKAYVK